MDLAGMGQGAVFHPRVGVEVIVDFEDGDPDRPIIVGRVYNGQNKPPTAVPTVSTFKTDTSPGGGSFNEIELDDTAGAQHIKLHTPRDWNCEVGNDRTEQVDKSSTSTVGTSRSETTGSDRTTLVGSNNVETVISNETITIGGKTLKILFDGGDIDIRGKTITIEASDTLTLNGKSKVTMGTGAEVDIQADVIKLN